MGNFSPVHPLGVAYGSAFLSYLYACGKTFARTRNTTSAESLENFQPSIRFSLWGTSTTFHTQKVCWVKIFAAEFCDEFE